MYFFLFLSILLLGLCVSPNELPHLGMNKLLTELCLCRQTKPREWKVKVKVSFPARTVSKRQQIFIYFLAGGGGGGGEETGTKVKQMYVLFSACKSV